MAGGLLLLVLALHAAVVFPALHAFLHPPECGHSECHEHDCVVVAFAHGTVDPGPLPAPVFRPSFPATSALPPRHETASGIHHDAEPPGRGPPPA
jgi:hypothetical protein